MHFTANAKEPAEAHDQRLPFFGVNVRTRTVFHQQRLLHMQPDNGFIKPISLALASYLFHENVRRWKSNAICLSPTAEGPSSPSHSGLLSA